MGIGEVLDSYEAEREDLMTLLWQRLVQNIEKLYSNAKDHHLLDCLREILNSTNEEFRRGIRPQK